MFAGEKNKKESVIKPSSLQNWIKSLEKFSKNPMFVVSELTKNPTIVFGELTKKDFSELRQPIYYSRHKYGKPKISVGEITDRQIEFELSNNEAKNENVFEQVIRIAKEDLPRRFANQEVGKTTDELNGLLKVKKPVGLSTDISSLEEKTKLLHKVKWRGKPFNADRSLYPYFEGPINVNFIEVGDIKLDKPITLLRLNGKNLELNGETPSGKKFNLHVPDNLADKEDAIRICKKVIDVINGKIDLTERELLKGELELPANLCCTNSYSYQMIYDNDIYIQRPLNERREKITAIFIETLCGEYQEWF